MSTPSSALASFALITIDDLLTYANTGQANPAAITPIANEIINGLSQAIYWACGRTPPMLSESTEFTETYNGSGSDVLYLINAPINSVQSVTVNGVSFPASTGYGSLGWFIQQDGKSIALRCGSGQLGIAPYTWHQRNKFSQGRGNVVVTYTAGYDGCPTDIYLLVLKQATVYLNKRSREDIASNTIPQTGQDNYRAWAMQPEVRLMLQPYARTAMANIF